MARCMRTTFKPRLASESLQRAHVVGNHRQMVRLPRAENHSWHSRGTSEAFTCFGKSEAFAPITALFVLVVVVVVWW